MPLLQGTSISLHPELPPLSLPLGSTASASSSATVIRGFVCYAPLNWEPYTPTITYTYECSFSSHYNVFESSHLVLTFSFGPKEPVLSEEDAVPTIGASAAGANLRFDPRVGQTFLGINSGNEPLAPDCPSQFRHAGSICVGVGVAKKRYLKPLTRHLEGVEVVVEGG